MDHEADILLVEDNPSDAELAMRALKKNNHATEITIVSDGEEALDYIFARGQYQYQSVYNIPRLILLDLKLPKKDGIEVLRICLLYTSRCV